MKEGQKMLQLHVQPRDQFRADSFFPFPFVLLAGERIIARMRAQAYNSVLHQEIEFTDTAAGTIVSRLSYAFSTFFPSPEPDYDFVAHSISSSRYPT
jgi:hypothetical protein